LNLQFKFNLKTAFLLIITLLVSTPVAAPSCRADETKTQQIETAEKSGKAQKSVSPEDQQSAMAFVREHHPELAHLLEQLQKSRPEEFRVAIRQIVPQTQAILRLREKSPSRYTTQLAIWKRDSEIRLLIARWARNPDPQLESQIKNLILQRQQSRQTELETEQKRIQEQLRKVNEQLQPFTADPQSRVDTEWQQLSKQAAAAVRSTKSTKSDKAPTKSDKTTARPQPKPKTNEPDK
jgi:hypothetical protein